MKGFAIGSVVVCEDIRREFNGKQFLIGVFGGNIQVAEIPYVLRLALWIEVIPSVLGPLAFHVRMTAPGEAPVTVKVEALIREIEILPVALNPIMLSGQACGEILIEASEDGKVWQELKRKPLKLQPSVASIRPVK